MLVHRTSLSSIGLVKSYLPLNFVQRSRRYFSSVRPCEDSLTKSISNSVEVNLWYSAKLVAKQFNFVAFLSIFYFSHKIKVEESSVGCNRVQMVGPKKCSNDPQGNEV